MCVCIILMESCMIYVCPTITITVVKINKRTYSLIIKNFISRFFKTDKGTLLLENQFFFYFYKPTYFLSNTF